MVTIKSVDTQGSRVDVQMDVGGIPGEMFCSLSAPNCAAPRPGKYLVATDETGGYADCVADVALFPESSNFSEDEKIGAYCLTSPEPAPYSCPVVLADPHTVDGANPYVNMSVKNTTDKVVTATTIRYASVSCIGVFTTSSQKLDAVYEIQPHQSFVFSTIAASEKILDYGRKLNGCGTAYFLDDVRFADGTEWKADPADHLCGIITNRVERGLSAPAEPLDLSTSPFSQ